MNHRRRAQVRRWLWRVEGRLNLEAPELRLTFADETLQRVRQAYALLTA